MIVISGPPFNNYAFSYPLRWHAVRWLGIWFSSQIDGISYFFGNNFFRYFDFSGVIFFVVIRMQVEQFE